MRLLIVTQAVDLDDPVLGFFHRWIEEFAKHCELIIVICLREGQHHLPSNVQVYSLGKEKGVGRLGYVWNFYLYIWRFRRDYDAVFVHMNPEYVVLGGVFWRLFRKPIFLWYSHRNVDLKLRVAALSANMIGTSAASSFRLKSRKVHFLGHGIDTRQFSPAEIRKPNETFTLITVGRITPIKRIEILLDALYQLRAMGRDAVLRIIGDTTTASDNAYKLGLQAQIATLGLSAYIRFEGSVPHAKIATTYQSADAAINAAPTGGLDKAVLESAATGCPVFVTNRGFRDLFSVYAEHFIFEDSADLANKIMSFLDSNEKDAISHFLRNRVVERASIEHLIPSILQTYRS